MTIDPTSGNVMGVGSLTGSGAITGSSLSTILTSASPPVSSAQGLVTILVQNNGSSAPAQNSLACWDSSGFKATDCTSGASNGVIGIVYATPVTIAGVSYSQIVRMGTAACTFDGGGATQGDYVVPSATTGGDCSDVASFPSAKQPIGRVVSTFGSTTAYVFTMNDMLPAAPALGAGNSWTTGTQSFALATALITPLALTTGADPSANGSIAYDVTDLRYVFGGDGVTAVPVVSPLDAVPTLGSPDTICALHTDSGCTNSVNATGAPHRFGSYVGLPAGTLASAGRSVRVTYHLLASSSSTPPTVGFYLTWTANAVTSTLFAGSMVLPPSSVTGQQFTVSCMVTSEAAASSSTTLYANCTSSALGTTTIGTTPNIYTLPILAIASNTTTTPMSVDTKDYVSLLDLAVEYSAATSGNSATVLSVIPEILQ